jgi:hypothetical protein
LKKFGIVFWFSTLLFVPSAYSFCGFYVAKADAKLFNNASQVVLVRHDDKTVMTMANDFKGDLTEFAVVIPVPTFIEKGQIHIGEQRIINYLDVYTAPRLVEYYPEERAPCEYTIREIRSEIEQRPRTSGVTVEAEYTVGEYDIVILSATQSQGLETWLKSNGYHIPDGAAAVLGSYIKQDMHFFVAKVNLKEQSKLGFSYLRPIQVAYESPKFMLPIRLGTVNAQGTQELFIYTLTKQGRVETTNYRTVKLPTDIELPAYVEREFADFYRAMFDQQVKKYQMTTVFLEYAWDMSWCDPCVVTPLSVEELEELGVFWLDEDEKFNSRWGGSPISVFVTRLHLRYDAAHFPADLVFQETADDTNFQGRYILRYHWGGADTCPEAIEYSKNIKAKQALEAQKEAQNLAELTGWDINQIREKMGLSRELPELSDHHINQQTQKSWWQRLWER